MSTTVTSDADIERQGDKRGETKQVDFEFKKTILVADVGYMDDRFLFLHPKKAPIL